jgi:signal peptidase II
VKRVFEKYIFLFLVAAAIIVLDQWTKSLVRNNIPIGGTWLPQAFEWLSPYARIVNWYNTGAAFGMFQNGSVIFSVLAVIVICAIIYYFPQVDKKDWTLRLAMSMQLAGASGNLIDRLMHNWKVTDFISVGTFAVFNIADASISVGTAVLLLGVYLQERAAQQEKAKRIDEQPSDEVTIE